MSSKSKQPALLERSSSKKSFRNILSRENSSRNSIQMQIEAEEEDAEKVRIKKRVGSPYQQVMKLFTELKASHHDKIETNEEYFSKIKLKVLNEGNIASLPEIFKPVIYFLVEQIFTKYRLHESEDIEISNYINVLVNNLISVQTVNKLNYPYNGCLLLIEEILILFEIFVHKHKDIDVSYRKEFYHYLGEDNKTKVILPTIGTETQTESCKTFKIEDLTLSSFRKMFSSSSSVGKASGLVYKKDMDVPIITNIINNPYNSYIGMIKRLRANKGNTEFRELKGVVYYLFKCVEGIKGEYMSEFAKISLQGINCIRKLNYPYYATNILVEELLRIYDVHIRNESTPGTYIKYYHHFRYRSYLLYMLSEYDNNIVFPTSKSIGSTDLIKIRCVPVLFLGVADQPMHADQYINTPLDFYAHDVQHIRRQYQETERYYDTLVKHKKYYVQRSPLDMLSRDVFYKAMESFTKTLLPLIVIKKEDSKDTRALKQWVKIIVFEVVHEKAWPITKFSLCRNIKLGYDIFPIETVVVEDGNIKTLDERFEDPTTLSNLYHKIRHGFYDNIEEANEQILLGNYRTSEYLMKAIKMLTDKIDCVIDENEIKKRIFDKKNADEFLLHKEIDVPDPGKQNLSGVSQLEPEWNHEGMQALTKPESIEWIIENNVLGGRPQRRTIRRRGRARRNTRKR